MKKIIACIIVGLVIVFGAVLANHNRAGSPADASDTSTKQQPAQATTTTGANEVAIKNFGFSPASLTIKKGTTVTWINQDATVHTVMENDSQMGPKSPSLSKDQTYSYTYTAAGTFKFYCAVHPDMTGVVRVTE